MARIYTSGIPDVPVLSTSVFTQLFSSRGTGDVGGFPGISPAFIDAATGTSITRAQLLNLSLSFGFGLRDHPSTRASAKRGDTVLIYSPNSMSWPVVLFGCVAAGLRCTLANSAYTSRELAHQYLDSGAKLLIAAEEGISTVRKMFSELGISKEEGDKRIIVLGRDLRWAGGPAAQLGSGVVGLLSMEDLLRRGKIDEEENFDGPLAHETLYVCYSSGTTGKPKGVETTHQNMTTVMDITRPLFPHLTSGEGSVLGILPFYHIYGVCQLLHLPFTLGWTVLIQSQFEPVAFCANIAQYKVKFAFIVPPVLVVLARHPAVDSHDLSSLEYMLSAAAPLGGDLVKQVKQRLLAKRGPGASCIITQGFGLTETTTGTHVLPFPDADGNVGSVGTLLSNLEARLVLDDDGNVDAPEGQPGELWIRGKTIMKGYLNNPEATRNTITPDGWFKTGDIVVRNPQGYYYVVDRRKELIKYKGFQVPPAELESVLLTHPEIADAAVIGVDSVEQATELPRAYVVHARPGELKSVQDKAAFARSVAKWIESKVAKHKFLRGGVAVIDIVPKSAAGKILRRELRELAKQEVARGEIDTSFRARL
ncbi:AMP binding protein [Mycena sp. CBHHK59/15]|nr:AMP binding protein [Mycena sp. CBHHK59/15]